MSVISQTINDNTTYSFSDVFHQIKQALEKIRSQQTLNNKYIMLFKDGHVYSVTIKQTDKSNSINDLLIEVVDMVKDNLNEYNIEWPLVIPC